MRVSGGRCKTLPSAFGRHLPWEGRLLLYYPSKLPLWAAARQQNRTAPGIRLRCTQSKKRTGSPP